MKNEAKYVNSLINKSKEFLNLFICKNKNNKNNNVIHTTNDKFLTYQDICELCKDPNHNKKYIAIKTEGKIKTEVKHINDNIINLDINDNFNEEIVNYKNLLFISSDNAPIDLYNINTDSDEEILNKKDENISVIDKGNKYDSIFEIDETSILKEFRKKSFFSDFSFGI